MPLVSYEWARALSQHSVAWQDIKFDQQPESVKGWWIRLAWTKKRCKLTKQLSLDKITPDSEGPVQNLLHSFSHLESLSLAGSISADSLLFKHLALHRLNTLQLQVDSMGQQQMNSLGSLTHLQQLSIQINPSSSNLRLSVPGRLSELTNLRSLSMRNVAADQGVIGSEMASLTSLQELLLVNSRTRAFDFSFAALNKLSCLLLSEENRATRILPLPGLSELSTLQRLSVSSRLQEFPADILPLTSLTSLDLGWNKFGSLPQGPYLRNLQELQFQERASVLDVGVLQQAVNLSLLSFDATDMRYKDIIATISALIKKVPSLHRVVLLKATYNGTADREDDIAQSFLQLVNLLGQDMPGSKALRVDLEHKWCPLLWSDVSR